MNTIIVQVLKYLNVKSILHFVKILLGQHEEGAFPGELVLLLYLELNEISNHTMVSHDKLMPVDPQGSRVLLQFLLLVFFFSIFARPMFERYLKQDVRFNVLNLIR